MSCRDGSEAAMIYFFYRAASKQQNDAVNQDSSDGASIKGGCDLWQGDAASIGQERTSVMCNVKLLIAEWTGRGQSFAGVGI